MNYIPPIYFPIAMFLFGYLVVGTLHAALCWLFAGVLIILTSTIILASTWFTR